MFEVSAWKMQELFSNAIQQRERPHIYNHHARMFYFLKKWKVLHRVPSASSYVLRK